ncbi:unnamed protein product [Rangifer tarandus platyrhynchus]|uniref:Uncharacterized protein n=1 Tax=Rangifer tarandus platyrhynchus TaxID=3082113 RepID=A0AC59ZGR7_RANTA
MPRAHWLLRPELNKICFFVDSRSTNLSQPGLPLRRHYNSRDAARLALLFKRGMSASHLLPRTPGATPSLP